MEEEYKARVAKWMTDMFEVVWDTSDAAHNALFISVLALMLSALTLLLLVLRVVA